MFIAKMLTIDKFAEELSETIQDGMKEAAISVNNGGGTFDKVSNSIFDEPGIAKDATISKNNYKVEGDFIASNELAKFDDAVGIKFISLTDCEGLGNNEKLIKIKTTIEMEFPMFDLQLPAEFKGKTAATVSKKEIVENVKNMSEYNNTEVRVLEMMRDALEKIFNFHVKSHQGMQKIGLSYIEDMIETVDESDEKKVYVPNSSNAEKGLNIIDEKKMTMGIPKAFGDKLIKESLDLIHENSSSADFVYDESKKKEIDNVLVRGEGIIETKITEASISSKNGKKTPTTTTFEAKGEEIVMSGNLTIEAGMKMAEKAASESAAKKQIKQIAS